MQERWHLVALHQIAGVGWHTIDRLLKAGWIPGNPISSSALEYLAASGVAKKIIERIRSKFHASLVRQTIEVCHSRKIEVITPLDGHYPKRLKEIAQPPWVLYVRGDFTLLDGPNLAVVGSRKPSVYGLGMTKMLTVELVKHGLCIVSGMAFGIDAAAHRSALKADGGTIAVLASGVDVVYPKRHRALYEQMIQQGTVISEMPPGIQPHAGLFPLRNRLISGLSMGTLVVEAAKKSGSLITANDSLEQGREVFAVPGPATSPLSQGTLQLIQAGAKCVCCAQDVLEELPPIELASAVEEEASEPKIKADGLNTEEKILLSYIGSDSIHISELLTRCTGQLSIGQTHQALLSLEMKQQVQQLPGSFYQRSSV